MALARITIIFTLVLMALGARAEAPQDALALVTEGSKHLKAADTLGVNLEIATHLEMGGEVRDVSLTAEVLLKGQQQSAFKIKTATDGADVVSDGKQQYVYRPSVKEYQRVDAPLDREDALGMIGGEPMRRSTVWLGQYVNASLDLLLEAKGEVLGQENGQIHAKLTYPKYTVEMWLAAEAPYLPQKLVMDVSGALGPQAGGAKAVNTVTLTNWQAPAQVTPEQFAWKAPEGAREKSNRQAPGADLLGKPAPDFALSMLDGSSMKLANHKDKEVVILDFFATWCGPCRMAMPIVGEVAKEYKSKGVALYAVNCRETPEKVKTFLASQNLEVPVAMDTDGRVQSVYGADSIPRMILIGKDGTVQAVHAGFSPALGKDLREQLDTLLAGKTLLD